MLSTKMRRVVQLNSAVLAGLSLLGMAQVSRADILVTQVSGPTAVTGGYSYVYDATLGFNSELTATAGYSLFGTLYDDSPTALTISNVTGLLATSFSFSQSATNVAAYQSLPTDLASLDNIRFTYTGSTTVVGTPYNLSSPVIQVGTNPVDLGQFTITSPYNTEVLASYDGQTQTAFGTTAGLEQGNTGSTTVPRSTVPEPASLALIGMVGLGLLHRRNRREA